LNTFDVQFTATAGSDVANIACTAVKTPDGKHYIVNGVKKWITNGTFADYFVTAVRTGGLFYIFFLLPSFLLSFPPTLPHIHTAYQTTHLHVQ
jgi:alkylation response protein AidB-like acyl-CoA dehydrogenase